MLIKICGGSKKQRMLAEAAMLHVFEKFMPRMMTLDVTLRIRKFNKSGEEGVVGWCVWEDTNIRPREFTIEASSELPTIEFIKTVIHEMVHVKQYATGQMKERFKQGRKTYWKDKDYTDISYSKSPWEREAYRKQETVYKSFMAEWLEIE